MKKQLSLLSLFAAIALGAAAQKTERIIHLNTKDLSMVMTVNEDKSLIFQYFGPKIDDVSPFLDKNLYRSADYGTDPQAYLASGGRNFREPALRVTHANGNLNTDLIYVSHSDAKKDNGNITETSIILKDRNNPLTVTLLVRAYRKENVFTQSVQIRNEEPDEIVLHHFYSSYLPLKAREYYLNTFSGAWAREMYMDETRLTHGIKSIESKKGIRTTQTENPSFVLALDQPLAENVGDVIAGALAWSGNYKINFQVDEFDILGITAGMNPFASEYHLSSGDTFHTPEMVYTYSVSGAGGASRNLHDWARNYSVYDAHTVRPALLNNWEGTYFDFNEQILTKMIDEAADMGLELFVLDDGWFGNKYPRNGDDAALGDWQVNVRKLPLGIDYVAKHAVRKGMKFGIWIEPEMVSPKSVLAETHPEWIVKDVDGVKTTIRNQWLLDLTNPAVQDFVFSVFDQTMKLSPHISYIKWDSNRHVESVGSEYLPRDRQSHFWIDYIQGLYRVYERIREQYPDVILQACSSGGGRVDYGALKYHQEVWTSDNTDPLSRIYIQYGTNMIYPAIVTGSHVSASPNHQTNRATPLKFRFDLAMSGRLGMELQPAAMREPEKAFARKAIGNYKHIRDIVMFGDLYRLASPYDNKGFYALMYVSKDQSRAVVYGFCIAYQGATQKAKFRLNGLDPDKRYRLRELNVDQSDYWGDGKVFTGQYLMHDGINPRLLKMYDSVVFSMEEVK